MELCHWYMVRQQKHIFAEAAGEKLATLEVVSRKATFQKSCDDVLTGACNTDTAAKLGLDQPTRLSCDEEWWKKLIENTYKEVIELASKEKEKDDAKKVLRKEKEEKVDEALETLAPEKVITELVKLQVRNTRDEDMGVESADAEETEACERRLRSALASGIPIADEEPGVRTAASAS